MMKFGRGRKLEIADKTYIAITVVNKNSLVLECIDRSSIYMYQNIRNI